MHFGIKLYMFRTVPLSIISSFSLYTQQYIQVCWLLASRIRTFRPDPARKLSANLYDGHKKCPKHVQSYSKNKFGILVHLVGFVIRIYHEFHPDPARKLSANLYDIYHRCVYS